jgi:hypothetical protein
METNSKTTLINLNVPLLYKETEEKYINDDTDNNDDIYFFCDQLYQHELLMVFNLTADTYTQLTKCVETLYEHVKSHPEIISLIEENKITENPTVTFTTLFSYDLLYKVYPILVKIISNGNI